MQLSYCRKIDLIEGDYIYIKNFFLKKKKRRREKEKKRKIDLLL